MQRYLLVIVAVAAALVAFGCKQEAPAPLPAAPGVGQQAQAQGQAIAPMAAQPAPQPMVVFASADPQHGGQTKKVGDYMVEMATGDQGKVDFYVTKYEGAVPSFENVQLEVTAKDESETDEGSQPAPVIFYPKDGKLEGTLGASEASKYDFDVKVIEKETGNVFAGTFEDVEITPLQTEMTARHDGTVQVVDQTKVEVVQEGQTLKMYLRDLEGKAVDPSEAQIDDVLVSLKDGMEESVELTPVGDHYEGKVMGEIDQENHKLSNAKLMVRQTRYDSLRFPYVKFKIPEGKENAVPSSSAAIKGAVDGAMKGTIGQVKVGAKAPPADEPLSAVSPRSPTYKGKKKPGKGPITTGKAPGLPKAAPKGKKKGSKGPVTSGKKAR